MPVYEFSCSKCQKEFSAALTVKEKEQGEAKCPDCGETDVKQLVSELYIQDVAKELSGQYGTCGLSSLFSLSRPCNPF